MASAVSAAIAAHMGHGLVPGRADTRLGLGQEGGHLDVFIGLTGVATSALAVALASAATRCGSGARLVDLRGGRVGLGLGLVLQPSGVGDVAADLVLARFDRAADPRHEHEREQQIEHQEDDQHPDDLARPLGQVELGRPRARRRPGGAAISQPTNRIRKPMTKANMPMVSVSAMPRNR